MKVVPDRDEGDAEEQAESSPKVCHLDKEVLIFEEKKRYFLLNIPGIFEARLSNFTHTLISPMDKTYLISEPNH